MNDSDVGDDVDEALDGALDDDESEPTDPSEAIARPSYHLARALGHVERALDSAERDVVDEPTSIDVMTGVSVYVDPEEGDVRVGIDTSAVSRIDREEALLLGQVLRVATEPERDLDVVTYGSGTHSFTGH